MADARSSSSPVHRNSALLHGGCSGPQDVRRLVVVSRRVFCVRVWDLSLTCSLPFGPLCDFIRRARHHRADDRVVVLPAARSPLAAAHAHAGCGVTLRQRPHHGAREQPGLYRMRRPAAHLGQAARQLSRRGVGGATISRARRFARSAARRIRER